FRFPEMIHEILGDEKGPAQIDVHHEIEIRLGHVPKIRPALDAGIVHEDIDLAELRDGFPDDPPVIGGTAQVALHRDGPAAELLNRLECLLRALADHPIVYYDIRALLGEANGDRLANALAASGHEGYF